jgi:hypothetical protein
MDGATLIRHLAEVESLVTLAEVIVAQQHQLIADMERDGTDTRMARQLLIEFEETLSLHIAQRDRLKAQLAAIA